MPDLSSRLRPAARTGWRHWPLLISAGAVALPFAISLGACGGRRLPLAVAPPAASASESPVAAQSATPAAPAPSTSAPSVTASSPPAPPPNPGSLKATAKIEPNWAACHQHYSQGQGGLEGRRLDGEGLRKGHQDEARGRDAQRASRATRTPRRPFRSRRRRTTAIGSTPRRERESRISNLAIKDSTGAIAGEDSTDDTSPVILEDGAVCFKEADVASVVVSVGMGKGAYALQIWAD